MLEIAVVTVSTGVDGNPYHPEFEVLRNGGNYRSPCEMYEVGYNCHNPSDVIAYAHDDLEILNDGDPLYWRNTVATEFNRHPDCVCVGFGGATALGNRDLYRKAYNIRNMARRGYRSNQVDWEAHGQLLTGSCQVAVVDAFFMAVRTDFLRSVSGWPKQLTHHCLDLWLACEAARRGKTIRAVGVRCNHHGGGTSTKKDYAEASWLQGGTRDSDHAIPHKWLWDEYRDVLPIEVPEPGGMA